MSVVLRAQIQESEAIRQTQAIEHTRITADRNRDCSLLMRLSLNEAKYFDSLAPTVAINNEVKKIISHQSSVISHWLSVTNLFIYHQSLADR
ncbi:MULTISPECIES: hypothetical protein [unclassified Microcoleus]|uniref:hypothetical protein n=1 Tax=unclassified Microcoleus TaxID=2642155 RepID=UPI0025FB4DC8|nr:MULTISPECIES: hypothetical protein [unclassified Microcoleus]